MAGKKIQSAKRRRFINNSIVHVILAILAAIWVFPIVWVVLTSFRAEQGSYVSTFFPQSYTLDYGYDDPELPENVHEHAVYCGVLMHSVNVLCTGGFLLSVKAAF